MLFLSFKLNISEISLLLFPSELSLKFQDKICFPISLHKNLLKVKELAVIYKLSCHFFKEQSQNLTSKAQVRLILCLVSAHALFCVVLFFFTSHMHIFWGEFPASKLFILINTLEKVSHNFAFPSLFFF